MSSRVIYGMHAVGQLLAEAPARVARVYLQSDLGAKRLGRIRDILAASGVEVQRADAQMLAELTGSRKHQGVAAEIRQAEPMDDGQALACLEQRPGPLIIALDGLQDPRNLGSVLRTANAAGADLVVWGRSRNVGFTPVVSKVAAGAAEVQPVAAVANLARFLADLRKTGVRIVGADPAAGRSVFDADFTGPVAIVLGSEGKGMRRLTRERCDDLVSLPMSGSVASLNVAVAAGAMLFEAVRQRRLARRQGVQ